MRCVKFGILIAILSFSFLAAGATANEKLIQKIEKSIREYLISKNYSWTNENLKVAFDLNTRVAERLSSYGERAVFFVPEIYGNSRITSSIILPIQVLENDQERERVFVRVQVSLLGNVVIAKKDLKNGSVISEDDLNIEEKNLLGFREVYFSQTASLIGKSVTRFIASGSVITQKMLKTSFDVEKSQAVKLFIDNPGLKIETDGVALEEGKIGDSIKVKRGTTGEIIQGKIRAPGKVEVEL